MATHLIKKIKAPQMESASRKVPKEEQMKIMQKQPKLAQQNLDTLDPSKITPLSPEVISRQATINIGTFFMRRHKKYRHDWTCGPRKIDSGKGYLRHPRLTFLCPIK